MSAYLIWQSDYYIPLRSRQIVAHQELNRWLQHRHIDTMPEAHFSSLIERMRDERVRCVSVLNSIACDAVLEHCRNSGIRLTNQDRSTLREQLATLFGWHPSEI